MSSQQRQPSPENQFQHHPPPPKSGAGILWIVTILFVGAIGFIIVKGTGVLAPREAPPVESAADAADLGIKLDIPQADHMTVYEDPDANVTEVTEDPGLDIPSTGGKGPGGPGAVGSAGTNEFGGAEGPITQTVPRHTAPMEGLTRFFHFKSFVVEGKDERHTLPYFLYKPRAPKGVKWPEDAKFPLVLVLHDARGIAESGEYLLQDSVRLNYPAFIVAPVLPEKMIWSFPSEIPDDPRLKANLKAKQGLGDAVQLVQDLINTYPIDPTRVYVMGCAEGGFGAYGAVLNYPETFAAAVVISGGWTVKDTPRMKGVPIWAMHGDKDKFFAPGLSMNVLAYIQQMGQRNVFWKSYPDIGRDCSNQAFFPRALWPWMFQQKKK
ncbi:MAG: dienelactone hydrolase family protein [Alphaproteobacteria bacterium]